MRDRHSSTIGFLDWLFNLVLSFVLLFVLVLLIAKVEDNNKKHSVDDKNEFIITARWNDGTDDDVDLWVQDPDQHSICYFKREISGMFLQRDDTGRLNKKVTMPDGTIREDLVNQEIANIRTYHPGQYTVNLHLYRSDLTNTKPIKVDVKLIKVNPYQEFPVETVTFLQSEKGIEKTVINFTLDDKGAVTEITHLPINFVLSNNSVTP